MTSLRTRAAKLSPKLFRWLALWLAAMGLSAGCALAQQTTAQDSSAKPALRDASVQVDGRDQVVIAATIHGIVHLDGLWRFHTGDDPRWADPAFDDSAWDKVKPGVPLAEQGIETYSGYGWYRLRLRPVPVPDSGQIALSLLVAPNSVGQLDVFINGNETAHTPGMTDGIASLPSMYQSRPITVALTRVAADGSVVIAVRSWAQGSISRGLLDHVDLGDGETIGEQQTLEKSQHWDRNILSGILVSFLFFCVAILGATLYVAQRNHSEYLWLSLLCLSVAFMGAAEFAFNASLIPLSIFGFLNLWTGRVFMAVTLEFVLRFTAAVDRRRLVRIVQVAVLLLPFVSVLGMARTYDYLSVAAQCLFCGLIVVLLFRAWRRGRLEAGVMLLPFFLAATADSISTVLDYAASQHWVSESFAAHRFHLGPIEFSLSTVAFLVFLGSLIAVILYRFVHVSKEEQRSAAEIEAARSVQAMLIPTQLPSNHNFMLESAYFPANGVGGDFFQALPLKDDSMLLVVGDVSGKGLRAAMNASTLVGALRNELSHDPATVLNHLNQVMLGASSSTAGEAVAGFATCLCARIYPSGKMIIANAGHLSPYRDGREMELAADLPLGLVPDMAYEQTTVQLKPGDRLVFLSDGVVEATNGQGELFGFERTQQVSHEPARYIAQIAQRFGQTDDITVVSLYFVASGRTAGALTPV